MRATLLAYSIEISLGRCVLFDGRLIKCASSICAVFSRAEMPRRAPTDVPSPISSRGPSSLSRGRSELSFRSPDPTRVEGRLLLAAGRPSRPVAVDLATVAAARAGRCGACARDFARAGVAWQSLREARGWRVRDGDVAR